MYTVPVEIHTVVMNITILYCHHTIGQAYTHVAHCLAVFPRDLCMLHSYCIPYTGIGHFIYHIYIPVYDNGATVAWACAHHARLPTTVQRHQMLQHMLHVGRQAQLLWVSGA